ncbi:SIR2 family protein [Rhodoferax saidenbachensis]|uniref:Uncharacterized protein n=1 Tax=Rhodoferax saidenbachensis TaxID=1484693 RepID=A0A1P8KBQ8_9BURK|nr:SIR2 family protein [Rhodoferax saidenbachensis]APW43405.1 hypothetical protein RS694_13270 [Rhodoferax saidenbachensis]
MDFLQLEEKLSSYGTGGYYLVESFLIKLLQAEAQAKKQDFVHSSGSNIATFDAFAPNGFGDIHGPVSIEIVRALSTNRVIKEANRFSSATKEASTSLLLISLTKYSHNLVPFIKKNFPAAASVYLWGPSEIQSLIDRHPTTASNLAENLFSNRFRVALESNAEDWKTQREGVINAVRDQYKSGRFSMFLGAGVSSSAGLPDWDTLLNSLFVSMLTEDVAGTKNTDSEQISSIVKRLRQIDGPSALMLARYIRKGITTDSPTEQGKFIAAVTTQLYGLRNKKYSISSQLIKAIANLCAPSRTGAKMRAVLTYNFDDLLEREVKSRGLSYRSIFEELDLPSPEELPIYHVHGFLPEDRSEYENINKATLVFSEEGYHQIYRESYHWSNLIQLNSLKETSCLMVGLSLTDPNLRRLLEISAKSIDKPKHFAFMKRITYESFSMDGEKSVVRAPTTTVRRFLDRHHKLNEEVLRELGVNIIWYENYDEIPTILQQIGKGV